MRFAVIDFECTSLKSDQGFLLCAGIKPLGEKGEIVGLHGVKRPRDSLVIDRHLAVAIRDRLETFDGWIGWNTKMFDLPFLDDRLLLAGEDPVEKRLHVDVMYYARGGQSRFSSSRLDWVAKALGVPESKTPLVLNDWKRASAEAIRGFRNGRENYDKVVEHCEKDIIVTEQVYDRLKSRVRNIHK